MQKKTAVMCLSIVISSLFSVSSLAQPPQGEPPQEAIDACIDKEEGSSVIIDTPHGELQATCKIINDQLFAVPANKGRRS